MRRCLLLLVLFSMACTADPAPDGPVITRSCKRSFSTTLDAWRAKLGDVPEDCELLDQTVDLQVTDISHTPCTEPVGVNEVRRECTQPGVIYLNQELDDFELVEAAIHGWVHEIADCADGALDTDHLRSELWEIYGVPGGGAGSVEVDALARAEYGECL